PVKPEAAPDVVAVERGTADAYGCKIDRSAAIGSGASQADSEGAGERGFGPAGIGRDMLARVSRHDVESKPGCLPAPGRGRCSEQQGSEPRSRKVGEVVDPGGGPAEIAVAFGTVTDHRISRIDRLIERDARQSGECE